MSPYLSQKLTQILVTKDGGTPRTIQEGCAEPRPGTHDDDQRSSLAEHKTESDQHDDAGHYSYIERCRDHINHIKRSLSTDDWIARDLIGSALFFLPGFVSYFTLGVSLIFKGTIKDLYKRLIMKAAAAPVGAPWMWTLHGYAATREAAMTAFAKSWRRE